MRAGGQAGHAGGFFLRVAAPEQKYGGLVACGHGGDGRVGQRLPPAILVRSGGGGFDSQRVVEQQHALSGPRRQMAVARRGNAQIGLQFLIDIGQAGRHFHPRHDRKRQAMRLPCAVIGVLPQDHHAHRIERGEVECGQTGGARGVDHFAGGLFGAQPVAQRAHGRAGQHRVKRRAPAIGEGGLRHAG